MKTKNQFSKNFSKAKVFTFSLLIIASIGNIKAQMIFIGSTSGLTLNNMSNQLVINEKQLQSGIYTYTLFVNDNKVKSDKIIINK